MKTIKYADDQAVMADSEEELQKIMNSIVRVGKDFGMNLNVGNTKVMRISRQESSVTIPLEGRTVQQVKAFTYLGYTKMEYMVWYWDAW